MNGKGGMFGVYEDRRTAMGLGHRAQRGGWSKMTQERFTGPWSGRYSNEVRELGFIQSSGVSLWSNGS